MITLQSCPAEHYNPYCRTDGAFNSKLVGAAAVEALTRSASPGFYLFFDSLLSPFWFHSMLPAVRGATEVKRVSTIRTRLLKYFKILSTFMELHI
jgi:hypothetical protein